MRIPPPGGLSLSEVIRGIPYLLMLPFEVLLVLMLLILNSPIFVFRLVTGRWPKFWDSVDEP